MLWKPDCRLGQEAGRVDLTSAVGPVHWGLDLVPGGSEVRQDGGHETSHSRKRRAVSTSPERFGIGASDGVIRAVGVFSPAVVLLP